MWSIVSPRWLYSLHHPPHSCTTKPSIIYSISIFTKFIIVHLLPLPPPTSFFIPPPGEDFFFQVINLYHFNASSGRSTLFESSSSFCSCSRFLEAEVFRNVFAPSPLRLHCHVDHSAWTFNTHFLAKDITVSPLSSLSLITQRSFSLPCLICSSSKSPLLFVKCTAEITLLLTWTLFSLLKSIRPCSVLFFSSSYVELYHSGPNRTAYHFHLPSALIKLNSYILFCDMVRTLLLSGS